MSKEIRSLSRLHEYWHKAGSAIEALKREQEALFNRFMTSEAAKLPAKGIKVFSNEDLAGMGFQATDVPPTTWRELAKACGMHMIVRRNDRRSGYYASWDETYTLPEAQRVAATEIKVYIGLNKSERGR